MLKKAGESSGLEFNSPAHGNWNIVHTGMLLPEAIQIYVCADNCMRGVVLTAAEMNAADRFSFVIVEEEDLLIDFAELRKINEDIVAWIQIPGIDVDYPVVQGEDNEYYLYHTFRKEANKAGSIFLDYRNRADFTEQRVIIYGHNMKDGSMFSSLKKYQDSVLREESGTVYLYLPEKTLQLEIVACERVSMRDKGYALEYNMTCDWPEEIILSTCTSSSDTRLILRCRVTEVHYLSL